MDSALLKNELYRKTAAIPSPRHIAYMPVVRIQTPRNNSRGGYELKHCIAWVCALDHVQHDRNRGPEPVKKHMENSSERSVTQSRASFGSPGSGLSRYQTLNLKKTRITLPFPPLQPRSRIPVYRTANKTGMSEGVPLCTNTANSTNSTAIYI